MFVLAWFRWMKHALHGQQFLVTPLNRPGLEVAENIDSNAYFLLDLWRLFLRQKLLKTLKSFEFLESLM
jgi:hypothetical protein